MVESVAILFGVASPLAGVFTSQHSLDSLKGLLAPLKSLGGFIRRSRVPKLDVSESEKSVDRSLALPLFRELLTRSSFETGFRWLLSWKTPFLLFGCIRVSF